MGAIQPIGQATEKNTSPEVLRARIDSMYQLTLGVNISAEKKNFNIPPFTLTKITNNKDAELFGPYSILPHSFDPSIEHEVYKFYTNKQMIDMLYKSARYFYKMRAADTTSKP